MKEIKQYQTEDGRIFTSKKAAIEHHKKMITPNQVNRIDWYKEKIIDVLKKQTDSIDFINVEVEAEKIRAVDHDFILSISFQPRVNNIIWFSVDIVLDTTNDCFLFTIKNDLGSKLYSSVLEDMAITTLMGVVAHQIHKQEKDGFADILTDMWKSIEKELIQKEISND